MSFSENLKRLRTQKGLSQQKLAKLSGVSQTAIYHWEKGIRTPKIGQVRNIAIALGVSISELIDDWSMYSSDEYKFDFDREASEELEKWAEKYLEGTAPENSWMRELTLLEYFRCLNLKGEEKALDYVEDLTKIPEYRKDTE